MTAINAAANNKRGIRAFRALAVIGVAASLAGCYQQDAWHNPYPYDYRVRHPISLHEGERTVEVLVGRNRGGLTPSQRADVLSFAQVWRREANSGIIVDAPNRGPIARAATVSVREITSILVASGIPRRAIYVRHYRSPNHALSSIKLTYAKVVAEAGPCGLWPHNLGPTLDYDYSANRPYWNFGCASQHNLAEMVENPTDFVQPRGESPAYTARRTVALDKYRQGNNPSGTYSGYETSSGQISGVGK